MRRKMSEEEKKLKITLSINEKLNELVDKQVEITGLKKSQIIEKILTEHFKNEKG